jgi:hypothetical protein
MKENIELLEELADDLSAGRPMTSRLGDAIRHCRDAADALRNHCQEPAVIAALKAAPPKKEEPTK